MKHISVLLNEAVRALAIDPSGIYVDATLGRGGHSRAIAEQLGSGHLYSFDLDQTALVESEVVLSDVREKVTLIHDNYAHLQSNLKSRGVQQVNGILYDLGVSSPQFDDISRGFSYRGEARLDMRMDQSQTKDAYLVVNTYDEARLKRIFQDYGEERFSGRIASRIVQCRNEQPIETTQDLVEIIKQAIPAKFLNQKGHPAKQVFQALRIEVNDELSSLEQSLHEATDLLAIDGTVVVISFQSLEDRIVKHYFQSLSKPPKGNRRLPQAEVAMNFEMVSNKALVASAQELADNNRAHSAKLRILRRVR